MSLSDFAYSWLAVHLSNKHIALKKYGNGFLGLFWLLSFTLSPTLFMTALKRFLLYARRTEIRGVDIDNPYVNIITALTVPDIDDVTVVDFDAAEERIYWTDVKTRTIKRAFINSTMIETVISGGKHHSLIISLLHHDAEQ